MAPAGSDERTTELAEPIDSENADATASDATPFGDWREQLRERVKEIRARKHAAHRDEIDDLSFEATAAAATAEKLEAARAQAADASPADGDTEDEPQVQLVDRERQDRRADIADIVDDLVGAPAAMEIEEPVVEPESLPAAEVEEPMVEVAADLAPTEAPEPPVEPADDLLLEADDVAAEPVSLDEAPVALETPEPVVEPEPELVSEPAFELQPDAGEIEAPLADATSEISEPVPNLEPPAETETAASFFEPVVEGEPEEAEAAAGVPPFQDEPAVFADDPTLELEGTIAAPEDVTEDVSDLPEATASADEAEPVDEPAVGEADLFEAEEADDSVPSWARSEASEFAPPPTAVETDGDAENDSRLDSIPPELRDVEIPAWALPREPSREADVPVAAADTTETESPTAEVSAGPIDAEPTDTPVEADSSESSTPEPAEPLLEDVHLVGEFTTPTSEKRTDLPPLETPVPADEMLNKSIGDLSALAESEVEIAPPGGLVDAADLGIDLSAEADDRSLPGLFDTAVPATESDADEDAQADSDASTDALAEAALAHILTANADATAALDEIEIRGDDELPADLDAVSEAAPVEAPAAAEPTADATPEDASSDEAPEPDPLSTAPSEAEDFEPASTEPAGDGGGLEWDLDNDLDAAVVADARQQHADASAPLSDRVYSALADGLVVLTMGIVLMIAGASAAGAPVVNFVQAAPLPFFLAWGLFGLVYGVIFVGTSGQTLGKMAMRVRVIGADTFHVGYGRAALRGLAYAVAALPAGLGLLSAVRDPEHRGLHDRLSSTRVVKA